MPTAVVRQGPIDGPPAEILRSLKPSRGIGETRVARNLRVHQSKLGGTSGVDPAL